MHTLDQHLDKLYQAADWALDDSRDAWKRTLTYLNSHPDRFTLDTLTELKNNLKTNAHLLLATWFIPLFEADKTQHDLFDVDSLPENIWADMFYMNQGVFGKNDPLGGFLLPLTSQIPGQMPLLISPQIDGWGIKA